MASLSIGAPTGHGGATAAAGSLSHPKSDVSDFGRLIMPNSGKPEFGWERGYDLSIDSPPLTPTLSPMGRGSPAVPPSESVRNKARANAVDFEATFLNEMFSHMLTGIDGDGPFGGGGAGGVWRSFLSDEYAKTFAKSGGIGLADDVYRSLIAQQEANAT